MNWKKFMSEGDYQDFLERALCDKSRGEDAFVKRTNADFCREYAMDKGMLIRFLETTQPETMASLAKLYKARRDATIFSAVNTSCTGKGGSLISTLKRGVSFEGGRHLDLFYPPSVSVLEKTVERKWRQNVFSVAREVWASDNERVDHVLFVNGLAIATIEMKCEASKQNYTNAIKQYRTERNPETRLFLFKSGALVHFALDLCEAWMTTKLDGRATHFIPFNKGVGEGVDMGKGNPVVKGHFSTEYMWEEILTRKTLSEIIARYVFVERKEKKNTKTGKRYTEESVIFPRYHQLDCVRKVLADVKENRTSRNYLIEHSAGSGKTNSIAWLAHQLSTLHDDAGGEIINTVVVVTDRVVVDRQLQKAILALDHATGQVYTLDEKKHSSDLARELNNGTKIIATTIQKFPNVLDQVKGLAEKNFAIIIDEAHSSTSGNYMKAITTAAGRGKVEKTGGGRAGAEGEEEERDAEDAIRDALKGYGKQPNLTMIAFTATPKPHTLRMFGQRGESGYEPFHVYSMKQAIQEEFIKDVLENYVEYRTQCKVIKLIADDPMFKQRKAIGKIKRILALHKTNIAQRTAVIIEHFRENVMGGLGGTAKAMIVTSSRLEAVKYRHAVDAYIRKNHYENEMCAFVAFSGKVTESGEAFTEPGMNGFAESELADRFDMDDKNILIVANKYQTGFDQKKLSAMYVLKKLSGVAAVQTLSRLNRYLPDKKVFVLDFVNTCDDMTKAFSKYYTTTILSEDVTPNMLYELLEELESFSIWTLGEVEAYWEKCCKRQSDATREDIGSILSHCRERFFAKDIKDQREILARMRKFVKWYDFMVQVAFLDDPILYKKRMFIDTLVGFVDEGAGGPGFSLKNKVDAIDFVQRKTNETKKPQVKPDPTVRLSDPNTGVTEDEEERLSRIIERLNSLFGTNLDPTITSKSMGQMEAVLKVNAELSKAAKVSTLDNYKLALYKAGEDVMSDCLDQNENFFKLLLNNDEAAKMVLDSMARRIYEAQRGKGACWAGVSEGEYAMPREDLREAAMPKPRYEANPDA